MSILNVARMGKLSSDRSIRKVLPGNMEGEAGEDRASYRRSGKRGFSAVTRFKRWGLLNVVVSANAMCSSRLMDSTVGDGKDLRGYAASPEVYI